MWVISTKPWIGCVVYVRPAQGRGQVADIALSVSARRVPLAARRRLADVDILEARAEQAEPRENRVGWSWRREKALRRASTTDGGARQLVTSIRYATASF